MAEMNAGLLRELRIDTSACGASPRLRFSFALALTLACFQLTAGCERDNSLSDPAKSMGDGKPKPKQPLTQLAGNEDSLALDALYYYIYIETDQISADTVSVDVGGIHIDRTNLGINFTPEATVGEVNFQLTSLGASITGMTRGLSLLAVEIPDPGDLATYRALIAEIEKNPAVEMVLEGTLLNQLPDKL